MLINKKRGLISLFIVALFIINLDLVKAFYNITYNCPNNVCIKGQYTEWLVTFSNKGNRRIEYTSIEIIDTINNSIITALDIPYSPLNSDRGNIIIVEPNKEVTIKLNATLPSPNKGNSLIFYPCFTTTVPSDDLTYRSKDIYELRHCYKINQSIPVVECISNNHCSYDNYCKDKKCVKLVCNKCQYIFNHICVNYECCDSSDCEKYNEACINNRCKKLNCKNNEFPRNHTCVALNCSDDQYIENRACWNLDCKEDEFAFNHTCKKLNCSFNEYIKDHRCELLECKENEYIQNHRCNLLECNFNETIFNHTCVGLECYFFQIMIDHRCINDKQLILGLLAEFVSLSLIIIFLVLLFLRYRARHKRGYK
jgi:hypothetical protein